MSEFKVDVRKLSKIWEHSNADSLSLANVEGLAYQFVIKKGFFNVGDLVVYFPLDSILPEPLIEFMELTGRLAGKDKNRVKTLKLRGEISQGFVATLESVKKYMGVEDLEEGMDISETLGVTKYEQVPTFTNFGTMVGMPSDISVYDIENVERRESELNVLLDSPCLITEKLEGTNWWLRYDVLTGFITVGSRNNAFLLDGIEPNVFWDTAVNQKLDKLARGIGDTQDAQTSVVLRGELIGPGIQDNYYKLKEHKVCIFDIMIDGVYVSGDRFLALVFGYDEHIAVPVLEVGKTLREFLGDKTIAVASGGKSAWNNDRRREGIVIKTLQGPRVILKQRCPEYLAKAD